MKNRIFLHVFQYFWYENQGFRAQDLSLDLRLEIPLRIVKFSFQNSLMAPSYDPNTGPKKHPKNHFDPYFLIFHLKMKDSELGTYLLSCASKFRFGWSNFQLPSPSPARAMIQTPVKKSWKNHPQPILCNIVSNLSNLFFSFVAREPEQTTSQSPNINPWKFQTILENHVFLWKYRSCIGHIWAIYKLSRAMYRPYMDQ